MLSVKSLEPPPRCADAPPVAEETESRDTPADRLRSASGKSPTVLNASAWSMVGYGFGQFLRLANNMVLSYLLVPEAFGTMALVNMVIVGLGMFSEVGAGPCIIQNKKGDQPSFLNTAFTLQTVRGFAIAVCATLLAWPVAVFYEQTELMYLIPIAGLTSVVNGLASPAVFTLQRRMDLKSLAWLEIRSQIFGSAMMCSIAWFYPTVWALVLGTIAAAAARTVLSHRLVADYRSRWQWNAEHARDLYRFGKWVFISTLLAFGAMQVDRMMLGKLFDVRMLGVYSFALAIATMPRMLVEKLCMSILYPLLAKSQRHSIDSMAVELERSRRTILIVGLAMVASVFVWCRPFFETFYHVDFHAAGGICQWLCAATWVGMLSITLSRALVAIGHTRSLATFNATRLLGTICASLVGLRLAGMQGFVIGMAVGALLGHLAIVVSLARHGILLLRQDFQLSGLLLLTTLTMAWLQQFGGLGQGQLFVISTAVCGGFWIWAVQEVRLYREKENAQPNATPPRLTPATADGTP